MRRDAHKFPARRQLGSTSSSAEHCSDPDFFGAENRLTCPMSCAILAVKWKLQWAFLSTSWAGTMLSAMRRDRLLVGPPESHTESDRTEHDHRHGRKPVVDAFRGTPMPEEADYSQIAEVYDEVRTDNLPHIAWWQAKLAAEGQLGPGKRLIDLGCGTGRWTIPLAKRTGCDAVGVDSSPQMLRKAREKDVEGRVQWVEGDVERLRFEPDNFDCALMVLMVHHLKDHLGTFRGVYSILRPGGVFLIRQGTLEQILSDPLHRFFPEAVTVDRKRTPFRIEIESWLAQAGFDPVRVETFKQHTYATNMRMLEEFQKRVCSALRMIDEDAYKAGMARLTEHLRRHIDDSSVRDSLFTLFVARKPE